MNDHKCHCQHNHEDQDTELGILAGFLAGGIIGAIFGILFAPRSGKETREQLKPYVEDAKTQIEAAIKRSKII